LVQWYYNSKCGWSATQGDEHAVLRPDMKTTSSTPPSKRCENGLTISSFGDNLASTTQQARPDQWSSDQTRQHQVRHAVLDRTAAGGLLMA
jgi:hypothetical protein